MRRAKALKPGYASSFLSAYVAISFSHFARMEVCQEGLGLWSAIRVDGGQLVSVAEISIITEQQFVCLDVA